MNIGAGPAVYYTPERLDGDVARPFYGLRLHLKAVVDRATILRNKGRVPARLRGALEHVDEVRIGYFFVPESLLFTPPDSDKHRAVYGATWRPFGAAVPMRLGNNTHVEVALGPVLTVAYLRTLNDLGVQRGMVFVRPGAEFSSEIEHKISPAMLVSAGAAETYYVPERIGGEVSDFTGGPHGTTLWRLGQVYVLFHYRIPVEVRL